MTPTSRQIGIGRPSFLSEHQMRDIYDAALHVLGEIGMTLHHDEAQALMLAAGCTRDDEDRVHVAAGLVAQARASAPASFMVYDRGGEPAMELGGYNSYFGTGSDLMHVYDLETGRWRAASLDDVAHAARLCDALPEIDFVMSCAYPHEVDPHRAYLEELRAMIAGTTKPLVMTAEGLADMRVMSAVAAELRGGGDKLRARPYIVMYNEPSSPLEHSRDSIDKLLFCADTGIPSIYSPAPLAGATAPITTAGHVAQGLAEALFGLVLHQLRRPGAPIVLGMGPAVLDMATAQSSYNAPEYLRSYACIVEMVKWLDLPNWGYGGTSDAQLVDAQAGMEAAELTLLSLLLGSNLNHDVGYLDFGLSGSFEQIVIVAEYIALNRRLLGGIVVDKETLALDVIADAGPGGNFLGKRHTAKHLRGTQWRPQVFNRLGRERWLEEGGLDLRERARRRALALLAAHQPPPLPQATAARIDELIDAYVPEV